MECFVTLPTCARRRVRFAALGLAISSLTLGAGNIVIVSRTGGAWQLDGAEKILINGKNKIRLGAAGSVELHSEEYKKQPQEIIGEKPLRQHVSGYLLYRGGSGWAPAAPDALSLKGSATYASVWQSVRFQVQKDKSSKGAEVAFSDVYAILPGEDPSEAAVDFLMDPANFSGIGEKDENAAFEERMSFLVAMASSVSEPAGAKLKTLLLSAMDGALREANTGIAKYSTILNGLRFADVSDRAFPADPEQKRARDQLRKLKAGIDRQAAILKALAAGEQWDPVIAKYGEFERFDNSFPDIQKLHVVSFQRSAALHLDEGTRLRAEKQYSLAVEELKLALLRKPGDQAIQELLDSVRYEDERSHAKLVKLKPLDPKSAEAMRMSRSLTFADKYISDGKLAEAEQEIATAETLDKNSPQILLKKARLLQARSELPKALETLDQYLRIVPDDDAQAGLDLRNNISYDLKSSKEKLVARLDKAQGGGDYSEALKAATAGAQLDPEDPKFLYAAGLNAAILRKEDQAKDYLNRYMKASQAMPTEVQVRAQVFGVLSVLGAPHKEEPGGQVNWLSGYRSSGFYCPVSLAPNAKPSEIRASRKQTVNFDWRNGQLASVTTVNTAPGESGSVVYFDYFPDGKGVRRAGLERFPAEKQDLAPPRLTPEGTIGSGPGTYFALFNHPVLNPYMVERLTGKRVATVVTGNPYFHPFVWTGVYTFLAEYDSSGRLGPPGRSM